MFRTVTDFENSIAEFYNAPYAVAVDCCTHAIELSLIYNQVKRTACPSRTYISIPFTLEKLKLQWNFIDQSWQDYYALHGTNIVDAAVYWKKDGYISGTMMCLSFQFKKHLSLGRGGAILVDNATDYNELKKLSYDGRAADIPWSDQNINSVGYHYYMTPETAQLGLDKLDRAIASIPTVKSYQDYPNLRIMDVFKDKQ